MGEEEEPPLRPPSDWSDAVEVTSHAVLVHDPTGWLPGNAKLWVHMKDHNLHPLDVHFWFFNLRANVAQRIRAWQKQG